VSWQRRDRLLRGERLDKTVDSRSRCGGGCLGGAPRPRSAASRSRSRRGSDRSSNRAAATGRRYGSRRGCWRDYAAPKTLVFIADLTPVTFLFYGVPTDGITGHGSAPHDHAGRTSCATSGRRPPRRRLSRRSRAALVADDGVRVTSPSTRHLACADPYPALATAPATRASSRVGRSASGCVWIRRGRPGARPRALVVEALSSFGYPPPGLAAACAARDEMSRRINSWIHPITLGCAGSWSKAFTPRRIAELVPWIADTAERLARRRSRRRVYLL